MATVVPRTSTDRKVICDAHNDLKAQIGAGAFFHLDKSERTVTSADGTDLPTALVLVNEIKAIYEFHLADALAHKLADPAPALVKADTLATALTLANAVKADYNTHRASTTYHYNADSTNAVAASDATDLATLLTLINEMKGDLVAHLVSGPAAASLRLVDC